MIVFETLRWKNFLSTGDQWTEINLDESQSTLIVGHNGSGKSTMLDALCFGLFNKPFRKITRGQLVNSINEKSTKVEVTFSIGKDEYRVFRGIKPNIFELYRNNKLVDQDAAANDTQKYLEGSVLKLNFKSFTQVVILGSSTFVPFMQLGASHRREVIEDLLDIKIFSKMNTLLKDRVRETLAARKECDHLLTVAEQKVSAQTKLLKQLKEVNDNRQKEIQDKIDANWVELGDQEEELKVKKKELQIQQRQLIDTAEQRTKLDDLKNVTSRLNLTLSSNQKRGNWGEIQVEKILEDSGLVKGQNFETQKPMESGKIPDVTLNLPEGQILNLDVKFPLNNYMKYLDVIEKRENSIDESDYDLLDKSASELKNDFLSDVRKRVNEVTKEGYIDPKNNTIDYALLFVPVEGIFQFIVENELELTNGKIDIYNEAIEKNIIMVPPSLLLVYYSTIKNAVETFSLQDKARDLIDLHKVFLTQWEKYRKQIEGLQASITSLQNKYDELTNVRSNELFKVVEKIDDLKFEDSGD